jgi:hypothetical protein
MAGDRNQRLTPDGCLGGRPQDGAMTHILVAMTLPSLASKMVSAGWPRAS